MYVIVSYRWGHTFFWTGRCWQTGKEEAHKWRYKKDAEDFAANMNSSPYEPQVLREDEC